MPKQLITLMSWSLTNANTVIAVHGRSVRQNHLITLAQSVDDFDRADRIAAQGYGDSNRFLSIWTQAKQPNCLLPLPKRRTAHVQNVGQPFKFNRSVNAQVRSRTRWYRSGKLHIND